MKRKLRFIDCGANIGQSIDWFINNFGDDYSIQIDSFEANPELIGILNQKVNFIDENINTHHVAVSTNTESKKFYLQTWGARTGSSLIKGKESTDENSFIETDTINLNEWLQNNCDFENEYVILKLDIEGTEYEIVESLLETGMCNNINALLVEWTPDVKFSRNKDMVDSIDSRKVIVKRASEEFSLVLDWHAPEDCVVPLKEALENNVEKT